MFNMSNFYRRYGNGFKEPIGVHMFATLDVMKKCLGITKVLNMDKDNIHRDNDGKLLPLTTYEIFSNLDTDETYAYEIYYISTVCKRIVELLQHSTIYAKAQIMKFDSIEDLFVWSVENIHNIGFLKGDNKSKDDILEGLSRTDFINFIISLRVLVYIRKFKIMYIDNISKRVTNGAFLANVLIANKRCEDFVGNNNSIPNMIYHIGIMEVIRVLGKRRADIYGLNKIIKDGYREPFTPDYLVYNIIKQCRRNNTCISEADLTSMYLPTGLLNDPHRYGTENENYLIAKAIYDYIAENYLLEDTEEKVFALLALILLYSHTSKILYKVGFIMKSMDYEGDDVFENYIKSNNLECLYGHIGTGGYYVNPNKDDKDDINKYLPDIYADVQISQDDTTISRLIADYISGLTSINGMYNVCGTHYNNNGDEIFIEAVCEDGVNFIRNNKLPTNSLWNVIHDMANNLSQIIYNVDERHKLIDNLVGTKANRDKVYKACRGISVHAAFSALRVRAKNYKDMATLADELTMLYGIRKFIATKREKLRNI